MLNLYSPNSLDTKYIKQRLIELKGERDIYNHKLEILLYLLIIDKISKLKNQ